MKPSDFKKIMVARADIPKEVTEYITTPEKLNLYDELMKFDEVKKLAQSDLESQLRKVFKASKSETSAQLEVLPKLLNKGYKLDKISELPIREYNKNQVENILRRKDFSSDVLLQKKILKYIDANNAKYLDNCIRITNRPEALVYWNKETTGIINRFINTKELEITCLLDRLHRRNHTLESVSKIFGEEKITPITSRLLEFKNYDKFKDIGIAEFKNLSNSEKKEILNGFISAISPQEILYSKYKLKNTELLQNKMKIFKEIDFSTDVSSKKSYWNVLKTMLEEIPNSEKKLLMDKIDTKTFVRDYRLANPIPTLVDDLAKTLEHKVVDIKGYKIKVAKLDRETAIGIATHRTSAIGLKTVEALEITDPKMLLCVGTKGGKKNLNFGDDSIAIAMKPHRGSDWHVQAMYDIDSGTNAMKNTFNFENIVLRGNGNHGNCIDLIPNKIKEVLNLSQKEYTERVSKLMDCTTLQELGKLDKEMENAIRTVIKEQNLYEGLMRPSPMGVLISERIPLEKVPKEVLDYCKLRDIPIIQVAPTKP